MKIDKVSLSENKYMEFNNFWTRTLKDIKAPFLFPMEAGESIGKPKDAGYLYCTRAITPKIYDKMQHVAGEESMAWFVILAAAFNYHLSKYNFDKSVTVSTPLFFLRPNETPLTDRLLLNFEVSDDSQTIKSYVGETKQKCLQVYQYQNYPLTEVDELGFSTGNVTNIAYYFPKVHEMPATEAGQVITFEADWDNKQCILKAKFRSDLYDKKSIEQILAHVEAFSDFLDKPDQQLANIPYMDREEKLVLDNHFIGIQKDFDPDESIVPLFENQVKSGPENYCLIYQGLKMSYAEVNKTANQLAHYLKKQYAVCAGDLIGVMMENSDKQIIGLLAVLKSGAAFVTIDPSHPPERNQFILEESRPKVLLIDSKFMHNIASFENAVFVMDLQLPTLNEEIVNIPEKPTALSLAYIIFTSGTTGKPKGVLLTHKGLQNTLVWRKEYYDFKSSDTCINLFPLIFDGSITAIFTALLSGGTLVIPDEAQKNDVHHIGELVDHHNVSNFIIVPSFYKVLLHEQAERLQKVTSITLAGEAVDSALVSKHYKVFPDIKLYNEYGPSENTVCTTVKLLKDNELVTIGKPVYNTKVRILDNCQRPMPIGAKGEIYIEGHGVALGYLNNQEMTSNNFLLNSSISENILYRTGDHGRWTQTGEVVYLGRKDQQVKINGFRIETEEISSRLKSHKHVEDALVCAFSNENQTYLAAYIMLADTCKIEELKGHLSNGLPTYMLPKYYLFVDRIPLNSSGKIDIKALPDPKKMNIEKERTAPRNENESKLAEIWKDVLAISEVGVTDHFFEIGGDSLKAMQLVSKMKKNGYEFNMKHIFDFPTIEQMASLMAVSISVTDDHQANQNVNSFTENDTNEIII